MQLKIVLTVHFVYVQANAEKQVKQLDMQLGELRGKLDEANRSLGDFDSTKKRLVVENQELTRQLEEAESQVSQLSKLKMSLSTQLEDAKRSADEEARVRMPLVFLCRFNGATFLMTKSLFPNLE